MVVDLKQILMTEGREEDIPAEVTISSFDSRLGSFPITEKSLYNLHLANQENKKLLLTGNAAVTLRMPCDRCLTEVAVPISVQTEKELVLPLEEDSEDVEGWLTEQSLDTDRLLHDELLMNLPEKVLCKEDCKGICPKCGCNLNEKTCDCDRTVLDPRMARFQDVFDQFKEV